MRKIIGFLSLVFFSFPAFADQIPPFMFKAVVAIGHTEPAAGGQTGVWVTEASGFFYGYVLAADPDPKKTTYNVFLVTSRHVIADHTQIEVRLDPEKADGKPQAFKLALKDDKGVEIFHELADPNVDIAVAAIDFPQVMALGMQVQFITADTQSLTRAQLIEKGYSAGDGVCVLGFPMGLTGSDRNYVITRKGTIARISDFLAGQQIPS